MMHALSRRILWRSLLAVVTFVAILLTSQLQVNPQIRPLSQPFQNAQSQTLQTQQNAVVAVEAIGMTVSDMDKAVEFYAQVLSFKKISDIEVLGTDYEQLRGLFGVRLRIVKMQLGSETIELTEYLTPKGKPIPVGSRSHDRWFQHIAIVVSDMDQAYQRLRQFKVQHTSTAPQQLPAWNKNAAGIRAFYFKDPDGHNLEIIYFPPGKGDPRWQQPTEQLFLGIDHTAIVVADTDASLKFYRNLLNLKLAGESLNYGPEQEHLNLVEGARLRITSLRASVGPGIEFLEYLEPQDGRSLPADAQSNDLLYWQTTLATPDIKALVTQLQQARTILISSGIVNFPAQTVGFKKGLIVRDPDGHALQIVER